MFIIDEKVDKFHYLGNNVKCRRRCNAAVMARVRYARKTLRDYLTCFNEQAILVKTER